MKILKRTKKGFTLVELIVVIAIVAILAAVSVVSYLAFISQANESADIQLVKQLNVALQADEALNGPRDTMHEMLGAMEDNGFVVENLTKTKSGYDIVWDQENNRFGLIKADNSLVYGESTYDSSVYYTKWKFADTEQEVLQETSQEDSEDSNKKYSIYLTEEFAKKGVTNLTVYAGLDAGNYDKLTSISYENTSNNEQEVVIRTNGGTLVVGTSTTTVAKGQIYHYGTLKSATVYTEENCFHTYGAIGEMNLKAGKVIAEENSLVYLSTANMGVKLEEKNGGKVFIPSGTTQAEDGTGVPISVAAQINITPVEANPTLTYKDATKQGGNVYEIGNLSALEQYRDLVNTGFNFTGITVKLVADIRLNDGWIPIGEGARKSGYANDGNAWVHAGTSFEGIFDGNGYTIYNLNNKGFVPTSNRLGIDGTNHIYSYGFIGQSTTGAKVMNLTFKDVDIDTSRYSGAFGDSVGSVIGFCAGGCELSNVSVYGSVKGYEAIGGFIGRAYNQDAKAQYQDLKILDCNNYANVECFGTYHAAGLIGYISNQSANINNTAINCHFRVTVSGCYVQGQIKTNGNDLSGLFNSANNDSTHTVKENEINCQLVYTGSNTNLVRWAAYISGGTSTFGTGEEANTKGNEFSAMVNNVDSTSSILEH